MTFEHNCISCGVRNYITVELVASATIEGRQPKHEWPGECDTGEGDGEDSIVRPASPRAGCVVDAAAPAPFAWQPSYPDEGAEHKMRWPLQVRP